MMENFDIKGNYVFCEKIQLKPKEIVLQNKILISEGNLWATNVKTFTKYCAKYSVTSLPI